MAVGDVLNRLAAAFIMRERDKSGATAADSAAQAAGDTSLLRKAQLAQIAQHMELAPKMQAAQIDQMKAHGDYYRAPKSTGAAGTANAVVDEAGNVVGYVGTKPGLDGNLPRFDTQGRPVGSVHPSIMEHAQPVQQAAASTQGGQPAAVDTPTMPSTYRKTPKPAPKTGPAPPRDRFTFLTDERGNITAIGNSTTGTVGPVRGTPAGPGEPATVGGTPVRKSPMTAQDRMAGGIAGSVRANIDKMMELANQTGDKALTTGPIAGRASKAYQSVMGPDGPEGDFDFYGNTAVDLVYVKSGKQINENEMAILRQMIPNRARGNLKHQVELFDDYSKTLLAKYGAPEPQVSTSSPGAPGAGGGGFKVVGVRPAQ